MVEPTAPRGITVFVGGVSVLVGTSVAAMIVWALRLVLEGSEKVLQLGTIAAVIAPLAWFFTEAGVRLLVNRPSRCGSILAISSWKWLGIWLAAAATWLLILGFQYNIAAGCIGAFVFGSAAWHCRKRIHELKEKEPVHAAV